MQKYHTLDFNWFNDKEKIDAVQDFFFRQRFEFDIKDKKVIFKDSKLKPMVDVFKDKFKDILGFDLEVSNIPKAEEKQENKGNKE